MRWITLLLVVVNLTLFGWFWQREQVGELVRSQAQGLPAVPPLVLLSEQDRLELRSYSSGATSVALATGSSLSTVSPGRISTVSSAAAAYGGMVALASSAVSSMVADVSEEGRPTVSAAVDARVAPRSMPGPEAEPEPAPIPEPLSESKAELAATPETLCYRLAYFATREEAEQLVADIDVLEASIDLEVQSLDPDYWVYIPDPQRSALRLAMRQELTDMGFDSYWIRRGELKGHLSLGLYRNKGSAESLYHLLTARGYDAQVLRKTRTRPRYVVDMTVVSDGGEAPEWHSRLAQTQPALKTEKKLCQGLASAEVPE